MAKMGLSAIESFANSNPSGSVIVDFDADTCFWTVKPFYGSKRTVLAKFLRERDCLDALRSVGFCQQTGKLWQLIHMKKGSPFQLSGGLSGFYFSEDKEPPNQGANPNE